MSPRSHRHCRLSRSTLPPTVPRSSSPMLREIGDRFVTSFAETLSDGLPRPGNNARQGTHLGRFGERRSNVAETRGRSCNSETVQRPPVEGAENNLWIVSRTFLAQRPIHRCGLGIPSSHLERSQSSNLPSSLTRRVQRLFVSLGRTLEGDSNDRNERKMNCRLSGGDSNESTSPRTAG